VFSVLLVLGPLVPAAVDDDFLARLFLTHFPPHHSSLTYYPFWSLCSATTTTTTMSSPEEPEKAVSTPDAVEGALDSLKPLVTKVSLGGVMGYCSGMALKKVGKALAFVVGLGFVAVQSAAYAGYIQVNWGKIADDSIVKPLDSVSQRFWSSCRMRILFDFVKIELFLSFRNVPMIPSMLDPQYFSTSANAESKALVC
jgi:uncharacterized membrane protein (Fun14 family)